MKRISYFILILVLFAATACNNYLKEEQYTNVGYDYPTTKVGMEAAVTGVYQAMRWYCGSYNQSSNSTSGGNMEAYYLSLIHISEPTRRTPISYAVFCLKKKNIT